MDNDFSLFPKLNPLPPAENARDPKGSLGKEVRRKKKVKKKDLQGKKLAPQEENISEANPDQKQVGKVLDITV
jgi:hypothetical protein